MRMTVGSWALALLLVAVAGAVLAVALHSPKVSGVALLRARIFLCTRTSSAQRRVSPLPSKCLDGTETTQQQTKVIASALKADRRIASSVYYNETESLALAKKELPGIGDLLRVGDIPAVFMLTVKASDFPAVQAKYSALPGVDLVNIMVKQ